MESIRQPYLIVALAFLARNGEWIGSATSVRETLKEFSKELYDALFEELCESNKHLDTYICQLAADINKFGLITIKVKGDSPKEWYVKRSHMGPIPILIHEIFSQMDYAPRLGIPSSVTVPEHIMPLIEESFTILSDLCMAESCTTTGALFPAIYAAAIDSALSNKKKFNDIHAFSIDLAAVRSLKKFRDKHPLQSGVSSNEQ